MTGFRCAAQFKTKVPAEAKAEAKAEAEAFQRE